MASEDPGKLTVIRQTLFLIIINCQKNGRDINDGQGPPTEGSEENIMHVKINSDLTCNKEWICEHRWREIYNMVGFRNVAGTSPVTHWWDDGDYQIAFGRGDKAFIVINGQGGTTLNQNLKTGLAAGRYCDLISGLVKGKLLNLIDHQLC